MVYKASAGSGKTFTLVSEYIRLLIGDPSAYRSILAVTFTNKAAGEMRERVLAHLYGIWKGLPGSQGYKAKIAKELGMAEADIARRAYQALRNIVHNFTYFRIETIDSFFQRIMRTLAKELDLAPNLRVSLDDEQLEQIAVDRLVEDLAENSQAMEWIMGFIKERMEDDKDWNVIKGLKDFGRQIFKDDYKRHRERFEELAADPDFYVKYKEELKAIIEAHEADMKACSDRFAAISSGIEGGDDSFCYKSKGLPGYFYKIRDRKTMYGIGKTDIINSFVQKAFESDEGCFPKNLLEKKPDLATLTSNEIRPLLEETERKRVEGKKAYKTALATMERIGELSLLQAIDHKARQLNSDANRSQLSDTQDLIARMVCEGDAPFVFEKAGAGVDTVMIDEFQDTSMVQWGNFKKLLDNAMAQGGSLIVGDVKQSIYRWRGGDWKLLNNIEGQFPNGGYEVKTLATNYRSMRNVVAFNNAFFPKMAALEHNAAAEYSSAEAAEITKAYEDVCQSVPDGRREEGQVRVRLEPRWEEPAMVDEVADIVQALVGSGERQGTIAVLVRNNREISLVAAKLAGMEGIRVFSEEAFRLETSPAVQMMVGVMKWIASGCKDELSIAAAAKLYALAGGGWEEGRDPIRPDTPPASLLPQSVTGRPERLAAMPLADLAEFLYKELGIAAMEGQGGYVCAFFDKLSEFLADSPPDLADFLKAWDEELAEKKIKSDSSDGVALMTVHASKGLEFDHVIVPFCDWKVKLRHDTTCWCDTAGAGEPFCRLPAVPVCNGRHIAGSIYEKKIDGEKLQTAVDNLNLLYVAFTRAKRNLWVLGRTKRGNSERDYRSYHIEKVLETLAEDLPGCEFDKDEESEGIFFSYGVFSPSVADKDWGEGNTFLQKGENLHVDISPYDSTARFLQSNKSRDFVAGNEPGVKQDGYVDIGTALHSVLSAIETAGDVDTQLRRLEMDGVLLRDSDLAHKMAGLLRQRIADERVAEWFDGSWAVFNECPIVDIDPDSGFVREARPDRVMLKDGAAVVVDYKFASRQDTHCAQVKKYMQLLSAMGYAPVRGYLWYVYNNIVEEVS